MATKELTGLVALGHMLVEEGAIVAVRLEQKGVRIDYDQIKDGQWFATRKGDLEAEGWELGWRCVKCGGDGIITVPCACAGRSLRSLLENPCCGGVDEAECPDCDKGVRWEDQY